MLLTSRTPLRVSFFGGGTDYPEYFQRHRGSVVGMAIDKYIYISVLQLRAPIHYNYRVSYSKIETVQNIQDIQHPVVREVLKLHEIAEALDIGIMSDLPASSGLGSSSAFTVGFLNCISAFKGVRLTKFDLAKLAIRVEREILNERGGVQDQLHASYGAINRFDLTGDRFQISPVQMKSECQNLLSRSLVLVFTGLTRHASATLQEQLDATLEKKLDKDLESLLTLTDQAVSILETSDPSNLLKSLGELMHEGWLVKKKLSSRISTTEIDSLYETAMANGALGGKLCGAGGGGFLLLIVPPEKQAALSEKIAPAKMIKVGMDAQGSTLIYS